MLKQGFNWFTLIQERYKTNLNKKIYIYISEIWQEKSALSAILYLDLYGQDF